MENHIKQKRQLTIYSLSNLIAGFGSQTYAFAISFYILQTTGSSLSFAIQLLCNVLPRTIAGLFVGELVDSYSNRKIIIFSHITSFLIVLNLSGYIFYIYVLLLAIYPAITFLSLTAS